VDEQCVVQAACKGENEHEGVVEAEATHVVAPVKGAPAVAELFVGLQHTALCPFEVFDDILVSSVVHLVYDGVSVARVECPDALAALLGDGAQRVVHDEAEERLARSVMSGTGVTALTGRCRPEGFKRREQPHVVVR